MAIFRRGMNVGNAVSMDKVNAYGDHTLACDGRIVRPAWDSGYTVVRFLPGINPENEDEFDPFRIQNSALGFGEWITFLKSVRNVGVGDEKRSFNLNVTYEDNDTDSSPYSVLYNTLVRLDKRAQCPSEWSLLLKGGKNQSAAIPAPKVTYYAACMVYYSRDKVFNPLDSLKRMTIMAIPTSAGRAMYNLVNEDWNNAVAQNTDPIDLVSFDQGAFVTFWNNDHMDPHSTDVYSKPNNTEFKGYKASFDKLYPYQHANYRNMLPTLPDAVVAAYRRIAVPLRKALKFMSHEEQAELIGQVLPAELLTYCWDGYDEWLSKGIKRRATMASVQMPTQTVQATVAPKPEENTSFPPLNQNKPEPKPVSNNQVSTADMYTQFAQEIKMEEDEDGGINWGCNVKDSNDLPY